MEGLLYTRKNMMNVPAFQALLLGGRYKQTKVVIQSKKWSLMSQYQLLRKHRRGAPKSAGRPEKTSWKHDIWTEPRKSEWSLGREERGKRAPGRDVVSKCKNSERRRSSVSLRNCKQVNFTLGQSEESVGWEMRLGKDAEARSGRAFSAICRG